MNEDPIVEEVRETRAKLLAECGGDFHRYMDRLRQGGVEGGGRRVASAAELKVLQPQLSASKA